MNLFCFFDEIGINIEKLVTILDVNYNSAKEYIDGRIYFEIEDLKRIADANGMSLDYLVREYVKYQSA